MKLAQLLPITPEVVRLFARIGAAPTGLAFHVSLTAKPMTEPCPEHTPRYAAEISARIEVELRGWSMLVGG
jgi:hypothetical protein